MKILLVSDFYPPMVGGLESHVHDLAIGLCRRGHEVIVATSTSAELTDDTIQVLGITHTLSKFGFMYSDPNRRFFPPWPDRTLRARLRDVVKRFGVEIIHSHGWVSFSAIVAGHGSTNSIPVVATLHDYGFVCPKMSLLRRGGQTCLKRRADFGCLSCASESYGQLKSLIVTTALRRYARVFKRANALVAVSHHVAQIAEESGLEGVKVIPPFIDLQIVRNEARANAFKFGLVDVLYAGGNKPWKGRQIFVDAIRKIKDGGSLITFEGGDPDKGGRSAFLPREEYLGRLARSRILVVPSISPEPFGLAAVEAMALGRAVIVSNIGGLSEIVENEHNGLLVSPGSADSLVQSMLRLANDQELCDKLGQQASMDSDIRFGESNTLTPLEETYERLIQ